MADPQNRENPLFTDEESMRTLVEQQFQEAGANVEVGTGLWALLVVAKSDETAQSLARTLLQSAPFPYAEGSSEDDAWTLWYVETAHRLAAHHWFDDARRQLQGEIRRPSPAQRGQIASMVESAMPHRVAQSLAEQHAAGNLSAGSISEPATVRSLLDRLHMREPLFYSAFHLVLSTHLIDLATLFTQLISEDVDQLNESVVGALSRDPFLRSRQDAAAHIRKLFIDFHVVSSLDQQKSTAVFNPYAIGMDFVITGDKLSLPLDGALVTVLRADFVRSLHAIRKNIYRGADFRQFDTQSPWMNTAIAYPFRYIKQWIDSHADVSPLDGLYMLERALE